ncbi:MAG: ribosome recycling factor [Chlorobi bacterium]|jgi:ribosome recycling factor|nr:ribosome recycling factor [Chlorobiota bacterium]
MDVTLILLEAEEGMKKAIDHCKIDFAKIRTGRATPSLLDSVRVDYYGSMVPISQVANVTTPDATMIVVQPWEKNMIGPIDRAIQAANIGLNPANDGVVLRLPIPPLTEERRREIAKMAKKVAEDSKIGVRNARRDAMEALKKAEKEEHMSEDARKGGEADTQKLTDRYIAEIEKLFAEKEKDILSV